MSNPYLKSQILGNSNIYTNVEGGFDLAAFEQGIGAHSVYSVESADQVGDVAEAVSRDLKSTNALFKVSIVQVAEGVPVSQLDTVLKAFETKAYEVDGNALFVLAGRQSQLATEES